MSRVALLRGKAALSLDADTVEVGRDFGVTVQSNLWKSLVFC